jgi:antitoxin component of RelBE/YafQ-DinJ toxin-antitoxin module
MYLTQVVLCKDIPFDVRIPEIPNELTAATLRKLEEGKELNEVRSVN